MTNKVIVFFNFILKNKKYPQHTLTKLIREEIHRGQNGKSVLPSCNDRSCECNMFIIKNDNEHYIYVTESGKVCKTVNYSEAKIFETEKCAKRIFTKAPAKTRSYYVINLSTNEITYKNQKDHKRRKRYNSAVRKIIYINANGKCELCGKRILFENMTLDHIVPLAMGGEDDVKNLQCSCLPCNQFKSNILPEEFMQRITDIFLYQIGNIKGNDTKWKVINEILR